MKISTVLTIGAAITIITLTGIVLWQYGFFDINCDPEDQVQITGILQGYTSNSSHRDFTDVRVDGLKYTFYTFDREMALQFIGCNVEINTCYQQNTTHKIKNYYDMTSIFLIGE